MRLPAVFVLFSALLTGLAWPVHAHQTRLGPLLIVHPYALSYIAGRPVVVYMTVVNRSDEPDRIVAVTCPRAGKAAMHEHVMAGDVMTMKEVSGIDIPAHGKAELKPGRFHIMLTDVSGPLAPGDRLAMTIDFEKAGRAEIEAVVTRPGATDTDPTEHNMEDHTQ